MSDDKLPAEALARARRAFPAAAPHALRAALAAAAPSIIADAGARLRAEIAGEAMDICTETALKAAAAERERIRDLARRTGAVCTGEEGTQCYFESLIGDDDA